ncbi:cysteine/O-acetylserine efflux protein [Secundilactobacillus pentosiphilus]|uniref:Cysteine/O-acetylserine efflux protein n=1 Tax=Secundilactobacillus pentosiphilus TaxID=1714682 RepID=A0A1Z5IMZ9_9LACO|nr:LysE family transporter [Secundilactobacillus pentosiphilus]GAX03124.1 cysteine/O-acetylserine efflux protein [Secundilactobacillus pentosiphilus]
MSAFFIFVFVMSFTPGPNTMMAMVSGQQRGFRSSLRLNLGMLFGMGFMGLMGALFAHWLQSTPTFLTVMKIVGSAYLMYLAYHIFISKPGEANNSTGGFRTGMLLQLTNIKGYLYFITGLGAFSLTGVLNNMPVKWLMMVLIGSLGTFAWTVCGQMMSKFYHQYYRVFNTVITLLLAFAAVDLWR